MTTYRLMDGVSGRPGVGSSGTTPPASVTSYTGGYVAGLVFQVTTGGCWFQGYWWWVATGGMTAAQKFALWQVYGSDAGALVAGSVVTSGALSAGWNYVPLSVPLLLSQDTPYQAATGFTATSGSGFPLTHSQFGSGDPYAAGITNGPVQAYSSKTGGNEVPSGWLPQMPYGTPGTPDPSVSMPVTNDVDDNLWIDVQVGTTAPSGATYRTFPAMPTPLGQNVPVTSTDYTLGREFSLSGSCTLERIWHYSPPAATVLPTRCAIWNVSTQAEVSGTDNSSPSWLLPAGGAASAGAGWVYCDYSSAGVTLSASVNYKVARFNASPNTGWFAVTLAYWSTGTGASGLTQGPLFAPGESGASPGQDSYLQSATWGYPNTDASGEISWGDVEVQPVAVAAPAGLLMAGII